MTTTSDVDIKSRVQVLLRDSQAAHLRGDFAGAAIGYRELAALVPSNRWVASKVALMAWHFRKPDEAIRLMAWYLGGYPDDADAWYNFGFFHQALGQTERATGLYQHALTKKPASVEAMSNLALCYMELGRPDDAAVMFDQALTVDATTPEARYNRSFVHLARGNYPAGFADYEARTTTAGFQWSHERSDLFAPDWKGEPLWPGAVLVVYTEQGFGDVIQFARFVPWVRGALGPDVEVRLEVPNELQRLFEQAWPDLDVVARGIPHAPYDAKVSLLSLPAVAGVTLDAVPPPVPFRPDATRFDLTVDGDDRPRVGLSWAGSAMHPQDARRSWPDDVVRALLKSVPGVRWFSLQIGEREDALTDPDMAEGSTFLRAEKSYRDFADTAALITHLDFVVAVDTAVAHLAGSLGVPTMVCVKEPSEWRWLIGRADSPWYPSIRVVRQHVPNDWSGVLDEIAVTLAQFTSLTEAIPA